MKTRRSRRREPWSAGQIVLAAWGVAFIIAGAGTGAGANPEVTQLWILPLLLGVFFLALAVVSRR